MPPALAKRIIQNHGANKVLFGSDLPWGGIAEEISFVESLDLPQGDFENILGNNAEKLLF
jgi:predicted TIM-barrel fold metal-dependent hydrolase